MNCQFFKHWTDKLYDKSRTSSIRNFTIMFQNISLTKSRIFLHKEIVLCKPPHMENQILWQSGNTISHPCYTRTHNFSNGLTIKLLQYVEEWNLQPYNSKQSVHIDNCRKMHHTNICTPEVIFFSVTKDISGKLMVTLRGSVHPNSKTRNLY